MLESRAQEMWIGREVRWRKGSTAYSHLGSDLGQGHSPHSLPRESWYFLAYHVSSPRYHWAEGRQKDSGGARDSRGSRKQHSDQAAWVHIPALLLRGCVTLSHCLDLSGPLSPELQVSIIAFLSHVVMKEEQGQEKPPMTPGLQSM